MGRTQFYRMMAVDMLQFLADKHGKRLPDNFHDKNKKMLRKMLSSRRRIIHKTWKLSIDPAFWAEIDGK